MTRNITIIGGSGFIGTRLACRLSKLVTANFSIVDKVPSSDFMSRVRIADVRSVGQLTEAIDENSIIINLAAEHRDDVSPIKLYDEVNVGGAINICSIARLKNINKIIFTSSVAVYGFARLGIDESGEIKPFNNYGRTKWEAEQVFRKWQAEEPQRRTLVIIRPTVVFGERNRGNVYNLLKQIASGKFIMIGDGLNRKSMAYVENVAAFIEYSLGFKPGVHVFNYIDKPDFTMNKLVSEVNRLFGRAPEIKMRLPYWVGLFIGQLFDLVTFLTRKKFPISSIRVRKFCADSVYESAVKNTEFIPPLPLITAIENTIKYEFLEPPSGKNLFYSE